MTVRCLRALGVGLLALAIGPGTALSVDEQTDAEAAETSTEEPRARHDEAILVEGSVPFAPTSNTIATKLPVPLAWKPSPNTSRSSLMR